VKLHFASIACELERVSSPNEQFFIAAVEYGLESQSLEMIACASQLAFRDEKVCVGESPE
jgi:hypothetical protein